MGSRSHLQGILPSQGSNPGLLHCRQILYRLSHQGSPNFSSPFSGRKVKLREGKGLPETTQQAGGRGTCDPSLGVVGLSGQEGLSRKSRLPSGPTHSSGQAASPGPSPRTHSPHCPVPPDSAGLPWAPAPRSCTAGDCAARLAGAQVISCNWVSGLLVVMLMVGRWDPWLLGAGRPRLQPRSHCAADSALP